MDWHVMDRRTPEHSRRSRHAHWTVVVLCSIAGSLCLTTGLNAAVKKVPYPEVKVELDEAYAGDAKFQALIASFAAAVSRKDAPALFALVGPTFVWTSGGSLTEDFDLGRDALNNFKVVFGFRAPGADTDGGVENGPFWDALAALAEDKTYYKAFESGKLICGPIGAGAVDENILEQARNKIETPDDQAEWYFTVGDTAVAKAPGDRGPPVAKVGKVALPVLSTAPTAKGGEPAPAPVFLEVLLPSGKTGWIPAASAKQLASERLCYAPTASGEWRIVGYDQPQ
jgi:hypothetical protein